jgi:hypothetical protein
MEAYKKIGESLKKKYSPEWIEWLRRNDLAFFAEDMLNMEVADVHKKWSQLVTTSEKLCIQAPRDHGKSFFFSFAYPIWRAYYNWIPTRLKDSKEFKSIPRVSIGYIFSNTQDQAIKLLDLVKREIEENPKLWHLMPEKKDVWSKTEIKLSNGAIIRARGWGVSVRGAHPVWIIADDCLNDESIYSELTRNKQIDYFYSAVTPMLVPCGQLVTVGTPFHQEDLYDKLKKNKAYIFRSFPALDQAGNALWPTRYNKENLLKRKDEVGSTRFSREYLCNAVSDDASLFPDYIIEKCLDSNVEMLPYITREEYKELDIFMGVDLALSSTVGADFTVITTVARRRADGLRILLDVTRFRGKSMKEQLRSIQDLANAFKPLKIFVENNGFQRVFVDELVQNTDLPVEGFTTTAHAKNDASRGVLQLQVIMESGRFVIPRKTEKCREKTDPLINELRAFSYVEGKLQGLGAHDDCVMSLWIAMECLNSGKFDFGFG